MTNYKVNPDFEPRDPTPADCFAWFEDPGDPAARAALAEETWRRWRASEGVTQVRITITGPGIDSDETGYPPGLWIEGWRDRFARQLPFGHAPEPGGAIYPPLVAEPRP